VYRSAIRSFQLLGFPQSQPKWVRVGVLHLLLALCLSAAEPAALTLTPAEQAWVAAHPVIRIQMSTSSPPFEFRENGVWKGMAYDYLQAAAARLGLRIVPTGIPWSEALTQVQQGQGVDLLLAVTRSREREQQMLLTSTYLAFPQVIFASQQHPFISGLPDLTHASLVVENDYVMTEWLKRDLPLARIALRTDTGSCLEAVSNGQAEAYVGNLAVASYLIEQQGLVNLNVVAPSGYGDEEFSMGIRRDWPELVALLDRAIAAMPPEEHQEIRRKWLAVRYDYGLRSSDIVKWVLIVAGIALVFIVQLRLMVNQRTAELKREIARRRTEEQHLSEAQRIAHLGSWTHDLASDAMTMSEETYRIFGLAPGTPVTFAGVTRAVHAEDRELLLAHHAAALSGTGNEAEFRIVRPDGGIRHLMKRCRAVNDADGRMVGLEGIVLDITERKQAETERARLEQSIQHSEKLRVIGQLASGIAHDFNNQLAGITGYADMLKNALARSKDETGNKCRRYTDGILVAASRAAAITTQLRIFSRRDELAKTPTDLHVLIRECTDLVSRGFGAGVTVDLQLAATRSLVLGNAAQLETALVNLAINARDAMPTGGQLGFTTAVVELDECPSGGPGFELIPGSYLHIAVSDTGCGMDATVRSRLFEPFFTTKEVGKGTGLGLANVYGCVKHHRGAITVDSEPGRGSCFHLYLPLATGEAAVAPEAGTISGSGTILLVEDNDMLRRMAAEMLDSLGYHVVEAADGVIALELFRAQHASIDLALVDMVMPNLDGRQTIAELRRIAPDLRVLLCSGSFRSGPAQQIAEADGFLQKPFEMHQLSRLVAETLAKRRPASEG
jgi:PAS domain S-box-containing protein